MSTSTNRRPYATVTPYTWMQGDRPTAGIVFKHGPKPFLHVTASEARTLADKLHDMADKIEAEPVKIPKAASPVVSAPEPPKARSVLRPILTSRSTHLTAADGTEESPLESVVPDDAEPTPQPRSRSVIRRLDTRPKGLPWTR